MSSDPLVSIVIPTHFRNEQLQDAIRSAQNQTYDPIEIIVVDDSGERHAEPVCADLDVTYLAHEENRGGNPARNTGIDAASGAYVQLLDDDDELAERKIEKQVELLESSDGVGVVYCGLEAPDGTEVYPNPDARGDVYLDALRIFPLHPCLNGTMLIDARVLDEIYPLAERSAADDIGMKIRLAERTRFEYVDEILYYKGRSESHRSSGRAFDRAVAEIVRENLPAYRSAPEPVRRAGMKILYTKEGFVQLKGSLWSLGAIRSFWRALRQADGFDPILMATFVSSLFGSPGHAVASAVYQRLRERSVLDRDE
jgi:glycosyltransferase involved in cell wall biosynthesis